MRNNICFVNEDEKLILEFSYLGFFLKFEEIIQFVNNNKNNKEKKYRGK